MRKEFRSSLDATIVGFAYRNLRIHREDVVETYLRPVMYRPKMGIVKDRKLGVKSKIFLLSKSI